MLKFVKQLRDFQHHRVSFAKCTQLERSPGISSIASFLKLQFCGALQMLRDSKEK